MDSRRYEQSADNVYLSNTGAPVVAESRRLAKFISIRLWVGKNIGFVAEESSARTLKFVCLALTGTSTWTTQSLRVNAQPFRLLSAGALCPRVKDESYDGFGAVIFSRFFPSHNILLEQGKWAGLATSCGHQG